MKTTTNEMTLDNATVNVTFVDGADYGFCVDTVESNTIAIVGASGKASVVRLAILALGSKGLYVAREVVRRLNSDEASELDLCRAINNVRGMLCV